MLQDCSSPGIENLRPNLNLVLKPEPRWPRRPLDSWLPWSYSAASESTSDRALNWNWDSSANSQIAMIVTTKQERAWWEQVRPAGHKRPVTWQNEMKGLQ